MAFLDPPYNVRVGSVVGRGRTKHANSPWLRAKCRDRNSLDF